MQTVASVLILVRLHHLNKQASETVLTAVKLW